MKTLCDNLLSTLKKFDSTLGDVRLKNAVFNSVDNLLVVNVVSDLAIDDEGIQFLTNSIKKHIPQGVDLKVIPQKSICDKHIAKKSIIKYVNEYCFAVAHMIDINDVLVLSADKKVVFELSLSQEIANFFERTSILENMCESLSREFSNDFFGSIKIVIKEQAIKEYEIESVSENSLEKLSTRYIKMKNVFKCCDDRLYDMAIYIADGENTLGQVYFAGIVTSKEERKTKTDKVYYTITLDDKSGKITGKFFTNDKNKLKKIEKLDVGSIVIIRGENELFNDRPSLMIKGFHFCEFPDNFTPAERPSKKAPQNYTYAFPKKPEFTKQSDLFDKEFIYPEEFYNTEFTVVDIETTGTEIATDKITEIGAVKIVNGKIYEEFQTLVNPEVHISSKITELTGIDDELVKNAPTIDKVFPDFYKFLGDSVFIAHNAEFDYRFLKTAGKNLGYVMNNEVLDTLAISRKVLPMLKHHKLNNVCDYYNIVFQHHRALSDAFATAELFLELKKDKNSY